MDTSGVRPGLPANANDAVVAEIKAEQHALDLTNEMLAPRANLDAQSVGRYLRRERQINVENFWRFAKALHLRPFELAQRAEARLARAVPMTEAGQAFGHRQPPVPPPTVDPRHQQSEQPDKRDTAG